jgi:hypothetical protein
VHRIPVDERELINGFADFPEPDARRIFVGSFRIRGCGVDLRIKLVLPLELSFKTGGSKEKSPAA